MAVAVSLWMRRSLYASLVVALVSCGGAENTTPMDPADAARMQPKHDAAVPDGTDCADLVITPGGPRPRSCVHEIPNGASTTIDHDGGVVVSIAGNIVATYPPCPCGAAAALPGDASLPIPALGQEQEAEVPASANPEAAADRGAGAALDAGDPRDASEDGIVDRDCPATYYVDDRTQLPSECIDVWVHRQPVGPIACGTHTCAAEEWCIRTWNGTDSQPSDPYRCAPVAPWSCDGGGCFSSCPFHEGLQVTPGQRSYDCSGA
jgi:hypothetical protein